MKKPDFDNIKTYEEFKRYKWDRTELSNICIEHGLFFLGSEKKLSKVIEAYFNGEVIPPKRNWYKNKVLLRYVNEEGSIMIFDLVLFAVSLLLTVIGIVCEARGAEYYVLLWVFGITGLIVSVLFTYWGHDLDVIMSYFQKCGDKRFTRAQVDEQACSESAELIKHEKIILAPDMLIGVTAGVAAIAYEDIASLQVKQAHHSERIGPRGSTRYRDYYTYRIIVKTNKGKKIAICESKQDLATAIVRIYGHCLKYNPNVELLDMKKSIFAPDESARQVTEGDGVNSSVAKAVKEQSLMVVSVEEDIRKRFIAYHIRTALILIPESLIAAVFAGGCIFIGARFLHTVRGAVIILPAVFLPLYAIYNLISVINTIRKNDIEFYSGEITGKDDKGYFLKGVSAYRFHFIKKMQPDPEPDAGAKVILARFHDSFSLVTPLPRPKGSF